MIELDIDEAGEVTLIFGEQGYVVFCLADIADEIEYFYQQLLAGAERAVLTLNEDCEYQLSIDPGAITCRTLAMEDGGVVAGALALRVPRNAAVDAEAMACIARLAFHVRTTGTAGV